MVQLGSYCEDHYASAASRGYGHQWRKIRARVLFEEPICRMCEEVLADEVDHIDGNPRNNERSNLRPLCKGCHSSRTATDQRGHYRERPSSGYIPEGVPPFADGRLVVVCGPPRAGKSTYVEAHRGPGDLVVDLDRIKGPSLAHRYATRDQILTRAAERGSFRVWFIIGAPKVNDRRRLRLLLNPGKVVVLETPPAVCKDRAKGDPRRGIERAIDRWALNYSRDPEDHLVHDYADSVHGPTTPLHTDTPPGTGASSSSLWSWA